MCILGVNPCRYFHSIDEDILKFELYIMFIESTGMPSVNGKDLKTGDRQLVEGGGALLTGGCVQI